MYRDVHRLAAVADVVRPVAEVSEDQVFAPGKIMLLPGSSRRIVLARNGGGQHLPIREVDDQLLPSVDDRIGQIAGVVAVRADGAERRVVVRARERQGVQPRAAQDLALIIHVDVVAGVPGGVVGLAGAPPAVGLARQLAQVLDGARGVQEGGQVGRQGLRRGHADDPMPCCAPGQRMRRRPKHDRRRQRGAGDPGGGGRLAHVAAS